MATITSITPFTSAGQNGQGGNVPVPVGTNRKAVVIFTKESSATITALTFDGVSFLANIVAGASIDSTAGPNLGCATYWEDIDDEVVAGDYEMLFSQSASVTTRRAYCVMMTDAAPGAPGWAGETFLDGVGTGMTFDLTDVTAGAAIIAAYANDGASITVLWGAAVTEDYDEIIGTAYASSLATADGVTAGTKTIATTASASDAAREQVLVAVAIANLSGPTVTSVDVEEGTTAGGTAVTITGTGFDDTGGSSEGVTFGGTAATSVIFVNSTTITCVTPAHAAGLVDVVVTNGDATNDTLTDGFLFGDVSITQPGPTNGAGAASGTLTSTLYALSGLAKRVKLTPTFNGVTGTARAVKLTEPA